MSTLTATLSTVGVVLAAAAVGTAYVLVHEHRRRGKKERKKLAGAGGSGDASNGEMSTDRLLLVLKESANAAYQLIEQVRNACGAGRLSECSSNPVVMTHHACTPDPMAGALLAQATEPSSDDDIATFSPAPVRG